MFFLVLFKDEGIYIAMALRDKERAPQCWQGVGHCIQSSDDSFSNATRLVINGVMGPL